MPGTWPAPRPPLPASPPGVSLPGPHVYRFRFLPPELPEAYSGLARKCFVNCKAPYNCGFLRVMYLFRDAVIKVRRRAPTSMPYLPPSNTYPWIVGKKEEVLDEARNGKDRPGKALSSCHPASPGHARISKEDRIVGGGNPLSCSETSSLEDSKKGPGHDSARQAHQHHIQPHGSG